MISIHHNLLIFPCFTLAPDYYERSRTHLSLGKDAPISRPIQPAAIDRVVEIPQVGGLHWRYERVAA